MTRAPLLLLLVLASCSAQVSVQSEPFTQVVPVTSVSRPVYAEVAIDLPPESQGDIVVDDISATLTVVNPAQNLSLEASIRLSLTGEATPDTPRLYAEGQQPAYFSQATVLLAPQTFAAGQRVPVSITSATTPNLLKAVGQPRVWLIVANTVKQVGLGVPGVPVEIRLEDITLRATVTKPVPGLGGAAEVGGL